MKRSIGSVDSLRTLASKLRPPGCKPPCSITVYAQKQEQNNITKATHKKNAMLQVHSFVIKH